jgi:hypothetical protein
MRKSHLDLLALAARLLEGFRIGQLTDTITRILGNFPYSMERRDGLPERALHNL